jgi:hypothetical protein
MPTTPARNARRPIVVYDDKAANRLANAQEAVGLDRAAEAFQVESRHGLSVDATYEARDCGSNAARAPALVERPAAYAWVSNRTSNPLVGTWKLVSWENRSADGTISYPLAEDAVGFILYTDDGYMPVAIMRRGREPFAAGGDDRRAFTMRAARP